jgi:hypothetical protein
MIYVQHAKNVQTVDKWNLCVNNEHDYLVVGKHSSIYEGVQCLTGDIVLGFGSHPLCSSKNHKMIESFSHLHPIICRAEHALLFLRQQQQGKNSTNHIPVYFLRFLDSATTTNNSRSGNSNKSNNSNKQDQCLDTVLDTRYISNVSRYIFQNDDMQHQQLGASNLNYCAVHMSWHAPNSSTPKLCLVASRDIQKNEVLIARKLPIIEVVKNNSNGTKGK